MQRFINATNCAMNPTASCPCVPSFIGPSFPTDLSMACTHSGLRSPRQLSIAPSPLPSTHSHLISSWHSGPLPSHLSSWLSPPFSIIPSKILVYLLNPNTSSFTSASTWLPSADSPEHSSGEDLSTAMHERLQPLPPHPRWALPALALPPAA